MWLLRDPWELSERRLVIPQTLAPLLYFCDGTRSLELIQQAFSEYTGEVIPQEIVAEAINALDEAFLLVNARSDTVIQAALAQYRSQAYRPPALAGLSYPGQQATLSDLIHQFGYKVGSNRLVNHPETGWQVRGVISPHIDYPRGGPVYAQVWEEATPSVLAAELVIILGTDHNGSPGRITLTRLPYATPYGVLPTDQKVVDKLAAAIGEESAFAEELNHRGEHSIELSAVWLHHVFNQFDSLPPPMIPVLIGSFHHHIVNGTHPAQDDSLSRFIDVMRRESENRRVLYVASVDLAHVGPNFGDPFGMDHKRRIQLKIEDEALMGAILQGNADLFYRQIAAIEDRNRICGFSPLYTLLRTLGATEGIQVAYQHCPADSTDTSLVSICGLILR